MVKRQSCLRLVSAILASSFIVVGEQGAQKSEERGEDLREGKSSSVAGITAADSLVLSVFGEG